MIEPEQKQIILNQQHEWYSKNLNALFEIVKELKNRTFDILTAKDEEKKFGVRYFYAGKVDYLKAHFEAMGILSGNKLINLYRSNALLKPNSVPVFSYDLSKRRITNGYAQFDEDYLNLAISFDLIFDIDSPKKDVMDAYEKAREVKKILDSYLVPYYCKNSGRRGFHFIIPAQYMPEMPIQDLIKTIYNVLNNFRAIHDMIEYIDLSVCNPKGLIKCSYSFDSGNISLPLNDYDFEHFSPEKVKFEYVMKNMILRNRGLFIRNHDGETEEQLKLNTQNFIEEYK
jgi:hypothetical protein